MDAGKTNKHTQKKCNKMPIWEKRNEINFIHEMKPEKYSRYEQTTFFSDQLVCTKYFFMEICLYPT